jgi:hypothetical protein
LDFTSRAAQKKPIRIQRQQFLPKVDPVILDEINHPQAARGPEARASAG